ncbi:MFS transporter [Methylobacterium sp. NEAU 140]|uniref:MFS transporter n=1 Tax=Methylobacterium sp. NEAU 140 TaxID=3064945 RepID=UPI00273374CC|nr:MFS transporter [Methylobacterium sp. NEAU 140]MDP4022245.1 MFS transporter [Methylobacterium sp. NEAU 140]
MQVPPTEALQPSVPRRVVLCLGASQLVGWGVTYYLVGGFGALIAAGNGWTDAQVHGGFSIGLVVMGVASPLVGRAIDRFGGRPVMSAGSCLAAAGCLGVAAATSLPGYYAAWICLGLAMRCALYDAAFAALARIGGAEAKPAMAQITLFGGLASTVLWPIGHALAEALGWRGALVGYAGLALLTLPLHLAIPRGRFSDRPAGPARPAARPLALTPFDRRLAGALYALIATVANVLNAAMSAGMINILTGLGLAASAAVWIATLRGIGQSAARLGEVLFGRRLPALDLNLAACALLPVAFVAGSWSGVSLAAAVAFALLYGAGNGVLTITRGSLPLALFDPAVYGSLVGLLVAPSLLLSAAAPLALVLVIERFGETAALSLCTMLALVALAAGIALRLRFGGDSGGRRRPGRG